MRNFITNGELRIEAKRLCDENERLQAENDMLNRELQRMGNQYAKVDVLNAVIRRQRKQLTEVQEAIARRNSENAKLRELARDLRFCARQSICLKCEHGRICDLRLDERCKELGI